MAPFTLERPPRRPLHGGQRHAATSQRQLDVMYACRYRSHRLPTRQVASGNILGPHCLWHRTHSLFHVPLSYYQRHLFQYARSLVTKMLVSPTSLGLSPTYLHFAHVRLVHDDVFDVHCGVHDEGDAKGFGVYGLLGWCHDRGNPHTLGSFGEFCVRPRELGS